MVFSTPLFLFVFFPVFFGLYLLLPARAKIPWLLIGSLVFYAWGEPAHVFLMAGEILLIWGIGLGIQRARDRGRPRLASLLLFLGVLLILGALVYFKYANLFVTGFRRLTGVRIRWKTVALPIGISFYSFQALSYLVDVRRGRFPAQRNLIRLGAYISMFPQLIAGPIVRYDQVARDLDALARGESRPDLSEGMGRMILGLGKKVLIANQIAAWCDPLWQTAPQNLSAPVVWLMAGMYALQIYYDFSGYSDMAIGMGRMLGFRFPENFRYPYAALSIRDFWRRWHISLSSWFRDYVYIPLGGSRRGAPRTLLNLMIVFALCGFWHGASWNFLLWGLYYGVLLCLEKFFLKDRMARWPDWLRRMYALFFVVVGWAIFAVEDFGRLGVYLGAMFGRAGGGAWDGFFLYSLRSYLPMLLAAAAASTPAGKLALERAGERAGRVLRPVLLALGLALSVCYLVDATYNPFLYFRF